MDSLYINRELSLLEFHKRVLAQAFDPELPLLLNRVHPVHELVRIDYFVPGCPPSAEAIWTSSAKLGFDAVPVRVVLKSPKNPYDSNRGGGGKFSGGEGRD